MESLISAAIAILRGETNSIRPRADREKELIEGQEWYNAERLSALRGTGLQNFSIGCADQGGFSSPTLSPASTPPEYQ